MNMLIQSSSSSLVVNSRKCIINSLSKQQGGQRSVISKNKTNSGSIILFRSSCRHLSNTARDTRMAGRRRFYKVVGVTDVSPPWESYIQSQKEKNGESSKGGLKTLASPISAGVDNSPSGVVKSTKGNQNEPPDETMKRMLSLSSKGGNDVNSSSKSGWYGITLDGSVLRTPLGHVPVSVPSYSLACAIAAEWNDQTTTIQPAQMPLMTLCCTALDQAALHPHVLVDNCLRYLRNDTTCYVADPTEERVLYRKQTKYWSPVHDWINSLVHDDDNSTNGTKALALATGADEGLIMSRARRKSAGLPHSEKLVNYIEDWCRNLDAWSLTALQAVAMEAKSFSIAMAVVEGSLYPDKKEVPFQNDTQMAVHACRVEEEFQIENWGLVEGGHDYDRLNCSIQVHAASLLVQAIAEKYKEESTRK